MCEARIFIVEDETLVAMDLADRLQTMGYDVCGHASRPEAALQQIPQARPDLVLMDINLGAGPNGVDVASRLRGEVDIPVIFLTAYSDHEVTEAVARSGSHGYLIKPFEPQELRANIELSLHRHATECRLREANRRLAESEGRFRDLFEAAPDAILIVDEQDRIVLSNRNAEALFGYGRKELKLLRIDALVPSSWRSGSCGSVVESPEPAGDGAPHRAPLSARRKDGSLLPVEIRVSPLQASAHRQEIISVRDVSERQRAEARRVALEKQLRHAQRMDAIGVLAGGIAHDFNNILAAIVMNTELARRDVACKRTLDKSLDAIAMASARAGELVKQILAFSRKQPATRRVTSLNAVIEDTARLLRATLPAGIELAMRLDASDPAALVDGTQLVQVLMNLGTNAWHAIEREKGRIDLQLERLSASAVDPVEAPLAPGEYARIVVVDDGVGMDDETLKNIFVPFFTTKDPGKGTGLGLSIVHGIVKDHGGELSVSSQPGKGTRVCIYLPCAVRPVPQTARSATTPTVKSVSQGHVLFVDDERDIVEVTTRLLRLLGYQVTGFDCAEQALEAIRSNPRRYDAVITDCRMPGMSGLEMAAAIRDLGCDLPIILASGWHEATEADRVAAGVTDSIAKPFTPDDFAAVLTGALSSCRGGRT